MKFHLFFLFFLSSTVAFSQKWTLDVCIKYAQTNSILIQKTAFERQSTQMRYDLKKKENLPKISAFIQPNYTFGRTIDPSSYQFVNDGLISASYGIQGSYPIFGAQKKDLLEKQEVEDEIGNYEEMKARRDVLLSVLQLYLGILSNEDQATASKKRIDELLSKITETREIAEEDSTFLQSLLSTEKLNYLRFSNNSKTLSLNLGMLLNLPDPENFKIEPMSFDVDDYDLPALSRLELTNQAYTLAPEIKISELKRRFHELNYQSIKRAKVPAIYLNTSLVSTYSNFYKKFTNPRITNYDTLLIYKNGETALALSPNYVYDTVNTPWFDQMKELFNFQIGFSINIPIINDNSYKSSVSEAVIALNQFQMDDVVLKQEIKKDIFRIYTEAQSAFVEYQLALKSQEAWQKNYQINYKKKSNTEIESIREGFKKATEALQILKYDYILKAQMLNILIDKKISFGEG